MIRLAAVVVLAILAAGSVWHRAEYWSWPWQGPPVLLSYCGRDYQRAAQTRSVPVREVTDAPLRTAFRAPPVIGRRVLVERRCGDRTATGIYRDAGGGRVVGYSLLGGP